MQEDMHNTASQTVPAVQCLFHRYTDLAVAFSPTMILLGRAGSESQHEESVPWSALEQGRDCHTILQIQTRTIHHTSWWIRLAHWGKKGKATKNPPHTIGSAARTKDSCITFFFLCCIQGVFGTNSLPDLIYHDYPPSPVSSSFSQGSSAARNCSYTCIFEKTKYAQTVQASSQRTSFQLV